MGVDFENVAVARVLGMSDLEMLLWLESGANRKLHMLIKHMQNICKTHMFTYDTSFC